MYLTISNTKVFLFTYGDGLSDVNIDKLISYHREHNKLATLTAVKPPGRYGALSAPSGKVEKFIEKPDGDGVSLMEVFCLSPEVVEFIEGDATAWEGRHLTS